MKSKLMQQTVMCVVDVGEDVEQIFVDSLDNGLQVGRKGMA